MKSRLLYFTAGFLVFLGTASAQVGEISISAGQSIQKHNILDPSINLKLKDAFRIGARLTLNTSRYFGHEFGYMYSRTHVSEESTGEILETPVPSHTVFYDFLAYALPEGSTVRPFVTGGGHFSTYYPPGASVYYGNGVTKFGLNYGGGVKVRISPILALRFDLREYRNPKPFAPSGQGWIRTIEASGGVGIYF